MAERARDLPDSRCTNVYFRALKTVLPVGRFFDRTRRACPSGSGSAASRLARAFAILEIGDGETQNETLPGAPVSCCTVLLRLFASSTLVRRYCPGAWHRLDRGGHFWRHPVRFLDAVRFYDCGLFRHCQRNQYRNFDLRSKSICAARSGHIYSHVKHCVRRKEFCSSARFGGRLHVPSVHERKRIPSV